MSIVTELNPRLKTITKAGVSVWLDLTDRVKEILERS